MKKSFENQRPINSSINFIEYNTGDRGIVFIHNAGGNNNFTRKQAEYFAKLGHHVINIDLPGHGESKPSPRGYDVTLLAEDVTSLCKECSMNAVSVVGLNYGGIIGAEMAYGEPNLISDLILLDPPILMEDWVQQSIRKHIEELVNESTENFAENLVQEVTTRASQEDKNLAVKSFDKISKNILASIYTNLLAWDSDSSTKLKKIKCPMLHIQSQHPFCPEETLKNICPQIITTQIPDSGHWMTMDAPDQVSVLIKDFLENRK